MSDDLSMAAHRWVNDSEPLAGATYSVIDGGIAAARRTGVSHHLVDAVEIAIDSRTTLAGRWLCGGSSVDAVLLNEDSVDCVGCRLAAAVPQTPCVYYAWSADEELLYVGSSVNVAQRLRGHMAQTRWWSDVRRLTFDEYATEHEARRAEFEAIAKRPGVHNREGVRRARQESRLLDLVIGDAS
jgi:hypothetical protein